MPTIKTKKRWNKYGFNTVLSFGKHKGSTIQQILACDPEYLEWMEENVEGAEFELSVIAERDRIILESTQKGSNKIYHEPDAVDTFMSRRR